MSSPAYNREEKELSFFCPYTSSSKLKYLFNIFIKHLVGSLALKPSARDATVGKIPNLPS